MKIFFLLSHLPLNREVKNYFQIQEIWQQFLQPSDWWSGEVLPHPGQAGPAWTEGDRGWVELTEWFSPWSWIICRIVYLRKARPRTSQWQQMIKSFLKCPDINLVYTQSMYWTIGPTSSQHNLHLTYSRNWNITSTLLTIWRCKSLVIKVDLYQLFFIQGDKNQVPEVVRYLKTVSYPEFLILNNPDLCKTI